MRRRLVLLTLLGGLSGVTGLPGCAGVEWDLRQETWKETWRGLLSGKDRGAAAYWKMIEEHTTRPVGGARYTYAPPAHIGHFYVHRGVIGLGRTALPDPDRVAFVADKLLIVLRHDPTPAVRAAACTELGHVLDRLASGKGVPVVTPPPPGAHADPQIHQISEDLLGIQRRIDAGERILERDVVERLLALAELRPTNLLSAIQMVRALAARPVAGVAPGAVTAATGRLTPRLVADCLQIALRSVVCGSSDGGEPDPEAVVRHAAVRALLIHPTGVAVEEVARRLSGAPDPPERDPMVRRELCRYLGAIGGPIAFRTCLLLLDRDVDSGVRFLADDALATMTGVDTVEPTAAAWYAWGKEHPAFTSPPGPAAVGPPESGAE